MMSARAQQTKGFTGWHMLGVMCLFFGVIIAVNFTMAFYAVKSWTGLVVPNSYVASQEFNERSAVGRAHMALGWTGGIDYRGGVFRYDLKDSKGEPVAATSVTVLFKRPVNETEDKLVSLISAGNGSWIGDVELHDGNWVAEISSEAGLGEPYRQVNRIVISRGELQ